MLLVLVNFFTLSLALIETLRAAPFQFPAFDDLPVVEGQPQGSLWGIFDKEGKKDEIGTLNLLTSSVVQAASKEIRSGEHVQLDWSLDNVRSPILGRRRFERQVIDINATWGSFGLDEEIYMNTQSGSQWDCLNHAGKQGTGEYYNGLLHSEAITTERNGIQNWNERGGIVGRGVLIDWLNWYEHKNGGEAPNAVSKHEIPVEELEEVLRWQGTETTQGDILLVRSGYVRWYNNASALDRDSGTLSSQAIGIESSEKSIRWLYNRHFAAVAGDTLAFEAAPSTGEWQLHEWLLVHWGTPIGEMWNLEELSTLCKRNNRWTFFLTSAPLHIKGGVASPPGAIAVF